jgi:alpha-beta hydrolase superfamily lysophospholipase
MIRRDRFMPKARLLASALFLAAAGARAQTSGAPGDFRYADFPEVRGLAAETPDASPPAQASSWRIRNFTYDSGVPLVGSVEIRGGYFEEAAGTPFRGNILYLEGLGDSMLNHEPLFSALSQAGWRVIAFDYMGQGGSGGTMNHTRVCDPLFPALRISKIADVAWNEFKRSGSDRKVVLGWSTGGLAAYEMASRGAADAVVLIAPGIAPKLFVGHDLKITVPTLTRADYSRGGDPHVDPIRPDSPVEVPLFAADLIASAKASEHWSIPASVAGLVLLSGPSDTYVDAVKTRAVLSTKAPHFTVVAYPAALHEIDNETPPIRAALTAEILRFLGALP